MAVVHMFLRISSHIITHLFYVLNAFRINESLECLV